MTSAVRAAPPEQQLALIKGHPDLAGKAARAGTNDQRVQGEQSSVGLDRLSEAEFAHFHRLNSAIGKIRHSVHRLHTPHSRGFDPAAVRASCAQRHGGRDRGGARESFASPRFA